MIIESQSNSLIKLVKKLQQSRKHRWKERLYFAEGWESLKLAVVSKRPIHRILFCPDLLGAERIADLAALASEDLAPRSGVTTEVFRGISLRNNPDGVCLLLAIEELRLTDLVVQPQHTLIAAVKLSDPGNLGTIIRSIDGLGAHGIVLVGRPSTDPYHPRTQLASRGTALTTPIYHAADLDSFFAWADRAGLHTIATSSQRGRSVFDVAIQLPAAILVGNEHAGLDDATIDRCDQVVSIPMQGASSSLNVGVATSIFLYEALRGRETQR